MVPGTGVRPTYGPSDTDVVGDRLVAQIVDLIANFVLAFVVGVLAGVGFQSEGAVFVAFIVVTLAYGTVLEGATGQTLVKMLTGVRVVDRTGDDVDYAQAFVRNVPALFGGWLTWLVGVAAIAVDERNQRLFDRLAGTYVIRD